MKQDLNQLIVFQNQNAFQHTLAEWRIVFWITFGVLFVTNVIFLLFGSGKVQKWNDRDEKSLELTKVATSEVGKTNL